MKRIFVFLLTLFLAAPAAAQQVPPYTYPQTIGTSSVTILAANPARKKLIFHNPNDTAKVAVCPIGPDRTRFAPVVNVTATINGAGCLTLIPYDRVQLDNSSGTNPPLAMGSAWVGVASAGGSALTIFEFE